MKEMASSNAALLVLDRGEELIARLTQYATVKNLKSAWLQGIGGTMSATIGFYDLETKQYIWKEFNEPLEITSLTGNLSIVDGKPFWHVHGIFSGKDYQSISGHVKELTVGLTGELRIQPFDFTFTRTYDETTGLKLITPME